MIAHSRHEAHTDALTGLRNRRSLMADLARRWSGPRSTHPPRWSCSTSTASRSTTTPSATRPATACWPASASASRTPSRAADAPIAWGATSSACCSTRRGRRRASVAAASRRSPSTARASRSPPRTASALLRRRRRHDRGAPARGQAHVRPQGRPARCRPGRQTRDVLLRTLSRAPARPVRPLARRGRPGVGVPASWA